VAGGYPIGNRNALGFKMIMTPIVCRNPSRAAPALRRFRSCREGASDQAESRPSARPTAWRQPSLQPRAMRRDTQVTNVNAYSNFTFLHIFHNNSYQTNCHLIERRIIILLWLQYCILYLPLAYGPQERIARRHSAIDARRGYSSNGLRH
jgi:hypothetical protein